MTLATALALHLIIHFLLSTSPVPVASASSAPASRGSVIIFELDEDDGRLPMPEKNSGEVRQRTGRRIGRLDVGSQQAASPIRYTLLRSPGDSLANEFVVDPDSGVISSTSSRLDRDSLCRRAGACCDSRPVCLIPLQVRAINPANPESSPSLRVEIHLRDINDNAPSFADYSNIAGRRRDFLLTLDENAHQGEEIGLPAAEDADATGNGIDSYELVGDTAGHFQLRTAGSGSGRLEPRLLVTKPLDRELTPELRFILVARDGGDPRLSGELNVLVRVNDKNDETPRFHLDGLRPPLTVRLPETHPTGADRPFLTLNATDADAGLNARIRYRQRPQRGPSSSPFYVNPSTGAVSLSRQLDYERAAVHHLVVEAVDRDGGYASGGVAPRTGSVTLTVSVLDVNDEAPVIGLISLSSDSQLSIDENKPADSLVAWLTVSDADSSGVRGVDCHLGDSGGGFRLLAKSGVAASASAGQEEFELRTTRELDAEATPAVNLTVVCTDRGQPPLTSRRSLRVVVNNLNDNAPMFELPSTTTDRSQLVVSAPENQRPGWLVCQLNASDADGDQVQFELLQFGSTPFRLEERTGRLYATESFDRELMDEYRLRVRVADLGKPPRSSPPLDLIVKISDLNDNAPTFRPGTVYEFSVSETAKPGQPLGVIHAEDADIGVNGQVQYSLAEFAARKRFRLDPETGQLATAAELDREVDGPRHSFTVWAVDRGAPRRTATVQVTVLVVDANDNPPRFMFPGQDNATIDSSYRNPAGATVAELQATDPDEGPNSELVYSLLSNGGGRFSVDPISGRLYAARNFDRSDAGVHQLRLAVRDRGQPSLSAEVDLRVALMDLPPEKVEQNLPGQGWPLPPANGQQPDSMPTNDRSGRHNSFGDDGRGGGAGSATLGRRGLLLLGCLAIPAAILAVICLVLLLLARGRNRLGRRADATNRGGTIGGGKPDIRLIVGGMPLSRFDCTSPAPTAGAGGAAAAAATMSGHGKLLLDAVGDGGDIIERGEFKAARHCPTLPMPQAGDPQRAQTLLRLGGGPDISNTYYRIPASDDDSGYDRGNGLLRSADTPATIDGRRGRRSSSVQQQHQPPAYQTLMQHQQQQQQQQQQPHYQSNSPAAGTTRRVDSQKRQFQLVNSSFV